LVLGVETQPPTYQKDIPRRIDTGKGDCEWERREQ
jgi:hypothetical protein